MILTYSQFAMDLLRMQGQRDGDRPKNVGEQMRNGLRR